MNTSDQINEIAAALAKAQGEMKNAFLNKVNPHFKSKYADLAGIRDAVTPALSKHGLAIVQGTEMQGTTLMVFTRLVHSSGQWFESHFPVQIDKPQAMGSGITYGRRYTLSAIVNIAADEDDDANAANEKPALAPAPVMQSINGTPGTSKAASRSAYEKLVKEVRDMVSMSALANWYKTNASEIDKLPPEWVDEFRIEYSDKLSELKGRAAA